MDNLQRKGAAVSESARLNRLVGPPLDSPTLAANDYLFFVTAYPLGGAPGTVAFVDEVPGSADCTLSSRTILMFRKYEPVFTS